MSIMNEDGSLKYFPLYSIFESPYIEGFVEFEKKSLMSMSRNWKQTACVLNLQTQELIWPDIKVSVSLARRIKIIKEKNQMIN